MSISTVWHVFHNKYTPIATQAKGAANPQPCGRNMTSLCGFTDWWLCSDIIIYKVLLKIQCMGPKSFLVTRLELYQDGLSFYFECNYSPSLHHTLSSFTIFQLLVRQYKSVLFMQTTSNQSSQEVFGAAPCLWQGQSSGTKQPQIDIFPQWSNFPSGLPTSLLACGVEAFK